MECKEEYKEVWRRTQEIQSDLDTIIQKLREYLTTFVFSSTIRITSFLFDGMKKGLTVFSQAP